MTRARNWMPMLVAVLALVCAPYVHATGVINISTCQTLDSPNTVYRLTEDLQSCETCFVFAADKVTLDMQGHTIESSCFQEHDGMRGNRDSTVVKNGTVRSYKNGLSLSGPRTTVLGVTVTANDIGMNLTGPLALVKSCTARDNFVGVIVGERGQVQQCNIVLSGQGIIANGDNTLVTQNILDSNDTGISAGNGNKATVSYNTVKNGANGIEVGIAGGTGHLVTRNVALNNAIVDYNVNCPSDVTYNSSSNGFPDSYHFEGIGCKTVGNE